MASEPVPARTPERAQFYERIAPANLAPLWENLHRMVTPEPGAAGITTTCGRI
jgi:gentisate 1,2-dioxygenase